MTQEVWIKPSLPGIWDTTEYEIKEIEIALRDASITQFTQNLQGAIAAIVNIYLPEEVQTMQLDKIILNDFEQAFHSTDDRPLLYPYTSAIILSILNGTADISDKKRTVTFVKDDLLKQDIYNETIGFYSNIRQKGEIVNSAKKSDISSSRLIKGINNSEADYILGYFLHMYWLKICNR